MIGEDLVIEGGAALPSDTRNAQGVNDILNAMNDENGGM